MRSDGSFERYKARLVGDGRSQQVGVDCDETFSPVVKPATIRTILSLAVSKSWPIHQLDVKNAFLHGVTLWLEASTPCLGLFLSQSQYVSDILERAGMSSCKYSSTLVDTKAKLSANSGNPYSDPTHYRSLAGALQYLTFTRLNISYGVQQTCLHMHDPRKEYMTALKRILRYVQGTLHYGLHLYKSPSSALVSYTDTDWGGCPDTRRSTSRYCVYLGDNLISWSSKRQPMLSCSSAEAEYRRVANVVARGEVCVLHVPSRYQIADIFTKGLPRVLFDDFRDSLSIRPPLTSTVKVY
ncbi:ribonuclease H-like domain-containing protein [Tanacetum coccineum]